MGGRNKEKLTTTTTYSMLEDSVKNKNNLKDSGVLVRLAYQGLKNLGVDADQVLVRAGLDIEMLYDSRLRTKFSGQDAFWQAAEDLSGDPNIGLHLGEYLPTYKGQVLEYLFLSSSTFGEGLERAMRYQRLISDALNMEVVTNTTRPYLCKGLIEGSNRHLNESMLLGLIKLFDNVTEGQFKPVSVEWKHKCGAVKAEYERIFKCPNKFECDEFRLYFDKSILSYRSLHAQPDMLQFHEKIASDSLAKLEHEDLVNDVSVQILRQLDYGEVTLESVSEELGITARQLRRKLDEAETSFQKVLNHNRHQLAKRLLATTDEAISEIVYLTGFSEPSTLYRAFKRWEGMTPIEYRKSARV